MIGVAISTHARPSVLAQALGGWAAAMPDVLVVTHDATGEGVAATKNRGIAALMDAGCDHLFLADDDVWPISPSWAEPYLSSSEPHLMHCWGGRRLLRETDEHTVWSWPRGVLLYAERHVVERVGGMRTEFGRWGGEHVEWSRRIFSAGLTTFAFADARSARRGVWFATDYQRTVPSTVGLAERTAGAEHRHALYARYRGSTDFVPFRPG